MSSIGTWILVLSIPLIWSGQSLVKKENPDISIATPIIWTILVIMALGA